MKCTPAPACTAVRRQASQLWPGRNDDSDGICASPKHTTQNPGSDHEPHVQVNGVAYATAVDLTDDKMGGCDADAWAEWLRVSRDKRVKYVIAERRMFSSYPTSSHPAWTWRPYNGKNPHSSHVHLSVLREHLFDAGPWFPQLVKPSEDDEMRYPGDKPYLIITIGANGQGTVAIPVAFNDVTSVTLKANDDWTHPDARVLPTQAQDGKSTILSAAGKPGQIGVIVGYRRA